MVPICFTKTVYNFFFFVPTLCNIIKAKYKSRLRNLHYTLSICIEIGDLLVHHYLVLTFYDPLVIEQYK